jgi:uncharacterized membrane protein YeiH
MAELIHWVELFGVGVFAASGGLTAARQRLDIFGFAVVAAVTGIGGGTLRDLLLGIAPVFWIGDAAPLIVCLAVAAFMFFAARHAARGEKALLFADALGLSLFCVLGAERALGHGASALVAIAMGVMSAAFGGIVRDVLCAQVPLIMRKEIYATAAALGAGAFVGLLEAGLDRVLAGSIAVALCFAIRGAAILRGWSLPAHGGLNSP